MFPPEIKGIEDVTERLSVLRSLRRASDARAINSKVSSNDTDVVNRWKRVEGAKGKQVSGPIMQHYSDFPYLIRRTLSHDPT